MTSAGDEPLRARSHAPADLDTQKAKLDRVHAQLAREIIRSAHLQLQGLRMLSDQAKQLPNPDVDVERVQS